MNEALLRLNQALTAQFSTLSLKLFNILQRLTQAAYHCVADSKRSGQVRLAATPGDMSILAVSAQIYANVRLGDVVCLLRYLPRHLK